MEGPSNIICAGTHAMDMTPIPPPVAQYAATVAPMLRPTGATGRA